MAKNSRMDVERAKEHARNKIQEERNKEQKAEMRRKQDAAEAELKRQGRKR